MANAQVMTEEELKSKAESSHQKCVGAHESIVQLTNEEFAKSIWGKKARFNEASIVRFFNHPSGEKVVALFAACPSNQNSNAYTYDQRTASDLLMANGVRVTQSYNTLWINANQNLLYAENNRDGEKIILELYCPQQRFLQVLRTGQTQSIEFLITGYQGNAPSASKIYGVLTDVHLEKQVIKCSNGHEFDKAAGYKFCPTCGESLK